MSNDRVKKLLEPVLESGQFSLEYARELCKQDWRALVMNLQGDARAEAESLFYFAEGFVEEVDEGFVADKTDEELYERARKLATKL